MAGDGHEHPGLTRRQALQTGAAAALGAVVLGRPGAAGAASTSPATLAGTEPIVAAMHVHAVYSEGPGSWEQQYANCVSSGVDVMWQTDHDFRARALDYMGLLSGTFLSSTTGPWRQHAAAFSPAGPIRVMVESGTAATATQSLVMEDRPTAFDTFRTGIDGQTLTCAFGASRLDAGARFEIVLTLSAHPAQSGRPAGQYSLRYRFLQGTTKARLKEGNGLVGVVRSPMPANGATVVLTPLTDIRALWPAMLATDHSSYLLSFVATSPRKGVVADVQLGSVTVTRVRHDAAGVLAAQRFLAQTYSATFRIVGIPSEELSLTPDDIAHLNVFGSPPEYALKADLDSSNWQPYYQAYVDRAHANGGVVSWNHPLGFTTAPLLPAADQVVKRQATFAALLGNDLLGADLLEVGYAVRGNMPFTQHLDLWDTFSRRARWITGNGASDDHSGRDWRTVSNGFLTGVWAASTAEPDLTAALASGRAYTYHCGRTPGLQLDTLVDGAVPMGAASVSGATSRGIAISVARLPASSVVELVVGPVDYAGEDPATSLLGSWPASAFGSGGSGVVTTAVPTSSSCFVRPQVRLGGTLVATGNPTWLLREPPADGIPAARLP
jgi:hypothetical protein